MLLGVAGEAQITDFGIARAAGDATATAAGMLKGTPAYIAPEIWQGSRDFRPAVDLFAVGCILYELATLRRLFVGESIPELFARVAHGDAREDVAPLREPFFALAAVLERLLERDPALRLQGASELEELLVGIRSEVWEGLDVSAFLGVLGALEGRRAGAASPLLRGGPFADPAWERARQAALALPAPPSKPERPAPGTTRIMRGYGRGARAWRSTAGLLLACAAIAVVSILVLHRPPAEPPETSPVVTPEDTPEVRRVDVTPERSEPAPATPRREERPAPPADPVTPTPTPRPEPSAPPPPVPVAGPGCLIFQSAPPGAEVWVDGQPAGLRARSGAGAFLERAAGPARVQMGVRGEPTVEVTVTVRAGRSHVVRCDLARGTGCRVSEAPGGCR